MLQPTAFLKTVCGRGGLVVSAGLVDELFVSQLVLGGVR
jgi:hypothetical protein